MMRRIKILALFLSSCEYGRYVGGAERRFLEISSPLQKRGVELFALEYAPSLSETWGYSGYHQIKMNRRFINHAVFETFRVSVRGIVACITHKCEIVYTPIQHCFGHNNLVNIIPAYIVSLILRKPLVIVFHHLLPSDSKDRNFFRLAAYRHAKSCVAVSKATADDFRRTFGLSRLAISSNGVNLVRFKNTNFQAKAYDAVFFGRIAEEKGVITLLKAWKTLITRMPFAQLLLLGCIGSEHMRKSWAKVIEELGLTHNVTISGFVSDKEALSLLKSSRIFVFPSIAEGFGLAVAEAMAAGLPCVLSNLPALKENFHSDAIFVEPEDAEGFAQAIGNLLSSPEKCKKLAKKGLRLVKSFSWESVAEREHGIFQSIVENKARSDQVET